MKTKILIEIELPKSLGNQKKMLKLIQQLEALSNEDNQQSTLDDEGEPNDKPQKPPR